MTPLVAQSPAPFPIPSQSGHPLLVPGCSLAPRASEVSLCCSRRVCPADRGGHGWWILALAAILQLCWTSESALARAGKAPFALEEVNVLLIVVDTLGAEHLGCLGSELPSTPEIDRLAQRSLLFRRAYSPASWTQPAMASLFTSRMPHEHGVLRLRDRLGKELPSLPEQMRRAGFATAAMVSNFLVGEEYGFARGFRAFDESSARGHRAVTSAEITNAAMDWLEARPRWQPFFLYLHYFDPHFDYRHHPEHDLTAGYEGKLRPGMPIWDLRDQRATLEEKDVDFLRRLHLGEVAYTDAQIGRLLAYLEARGLADDTLVILTSDHGEEIMQHGWIGHTRTLYEELLHIPMMISLPGRIEPGESSIPVSLLDILPTLVDLSRTQRSDPAWRGVSLRPLLFDLGARTKPDADLTERNLFAEVSFVADVENVRRKSVKTAFKTALLTPEGLKLIHDLTEGRWELYDLGQDALEIDDLWGRQGRERQLRKVLLSWEKKRRKRANDPGENLLPTGDDVERLRALGYID